MNQNSKKIMELRIARHTDNLNKIKEFYTEIIGLKVLFSFENHNGYNGVFLGKEGTTWHLEFTSSKDKANHKFDDEDLLVFYPREQTDYDEIIGRIETCNIQQFKPKNPFWVDNGVLIHDPDGYGVIVSSLKVGLD